MSAKWDGPDFVGASASGRDSVSEHADELFLEDGKGQAWFYTAEWQEMEAHADADFAAGRVVRHESDDAFLAALAEDVEDEQSAAGER